MVVNYTKLTKEENIYKLLNIVDCLQPDRSKTTTHAEKKVLVELLLLPEEQFGIYRFTKYARKRILESSKQKGWDLSPRNMMNRFRSLREKGLIYKQADGEMYVKKWLLKACNKMLEALEKGEHYEIKFRFSDERNPEGSTV